MRPYAMPEPPRQLSLFSGTLPAPSVPAPVQAVRARPEEANRLASVPARDELWARAEALAFELSRDLGMPVRLAVTDNRSTMVSFRRGASALRLRLHHMFLDAPEPVVRAVADYAGRGQPRARAACWTTTSGASSRASARSAAGRTRTSSPRGRCFDLQALFDAAQPTPTSRAASRRASAGGACRRGGGASPSAWASTTTRRARFASTPRWTGRTCPPTSWSSSSSTRCSTSSSRAPDGTGRRVHHPRAFRDREKAFPLYDAALRWERENLTLLLRG